MPHKMSSRQSTRSDPCDPGKMERKERKGRKPKPCAIPWVKPQSRGPPAQRPRFRVEQEQIQKRTFTNWVNAQLSKRRPPVAVVDLFNDLRDGSRLLDLLEVLCSQRMSREKGKGMFQHRANIEKALTFLRRKSIKLVNINVPDIMDGKPSIILGLIWTIIMHFHIEELACTLSFSSRQSSLESLASLDTQSTSSSSGAWSGPAPPRGSPLHTRFRISAKKALMLWVREQCHKAGSTLNVKDFKGSWRSGVVFLAILCALRPNVVDLSKARTRTNRQNLEEAFQIAERELHIPRLLDPADVDVRDPDEKSIMTYVAQFLQYSKDTPVSDEDMQVHYPTSSESLAPVNLPTNFTPATATSPLRQSSANQKAQEVTCWLVQAFQELLEGWDSTEGASYAERYHVFHTFVVSFNEQRRPVIPLLTAMKRTPRLSEEQRALRCAWDDLAEKLREYKTELDLTLPAPLDTVGRWMLRVEEALTDGEDDSHDHVHAAQEARHKQALLKSCLEEMPQHIKTFQTFQNIDEYSEMLVPTDKLEEMKRRFTSVRVSAKYHDIKLEYQEHRHTVLDLLGQLSLKLRTWKRAYISQEAVRVLMQDWNEIVNKQELPSLLEGALYKLKHIVSKYTSKSALAGDAIHVSRQVKDLEAETTVTLEDVRMVKGTMGRVLVAWDTYSDSYSSLHAWLEQGMQKNRHGQQAEVTAGIMLEWSSRQNQLNKVGNYLIEITDPQTSRSLSDELCRINLLWADFARRTQFGLVEELSVGPASPQTLQGLVREATQLLKEPVDVLSGSLRTYRKRLQFMMQKIKDVDLDSLSPSLECSAETVNKLKQATPEVLQTLCEAVHVCEELLQSVCGLEGRLAELLHWEIEARELYQLLRGYERRQDSGTRVLISRGLQLEGQVVTEEQDLQVMVMSAQKNSPLQYLIASTMQDRVCAAVAQSQETVGMLSSMGATEHQPPKKIFVREKESETTTPRPKTSDPVQPFIAQGGAGQADSQPSNGSQHLSHLSLPGAQAGAAKVQPVPMIVVQEHQEEKKSPPPHAQTQAEAQVHVRNEPVEEHQHQGKPESATESEVSAGVKPEALSKDQAKDGVLEEPRKPEEGIKKTGQPEIYRDTNQNTQQAQTSSQPQTPTSCQAVSLQGVPTQPQMPRQPQMQAQPHMQAQAQMQAQPQWYAQLQVYAHQQMQSQEPNTQQRTHSQQQVQFKKRGSSQQQTTFHQSIKGRKSHVRPENRPWLQQKTQAKVSSAAKAQSGVKDVKQLSSEVQRHHADFATSGCQPQVSPPDPVQAQAKKVTKTQAKVNQGQQQKAVTQAREGQLQQQQSVLEVKVEPEIQMPPKSQEQTMKPVMGEVKQTTTQPVRHPSAPIQPQIMNQRKPQQVVTQSKNQHSVSFPVTVTPAQPKGPAPIQPRIIAMPQSPPLTHAPPQPQIMGVSQSPAKVQVRPQSAVLAQVQPHTQHPQWTSVMSDAIAQRYHDAQAQGLMATQVLAQAQFQNYPQPQTKLQQWPPIRGVQMTQTYPSVQGSGQAQVQPPPHAQVYHSPQTQTQPWAPVRAEPLPQAFVQIRAQSPVRPIVPSQHWRPMRPEVISHGYQRFQLQDQGPMSLYPLAKPQTHPRAQSPSQQRGSTQPDHSQVYSQKMVQGFSPPITHQPRVQPLSQAPARPQAPTPQQPQTRQQLRPQNRAEVPSQGQTQSQAPQVLPQVQVSQKPQSPVLEQTQQHSAAKVKPPALAQAPPQAYTEAYIKAQALARNRFEEAKHCLQEHILEAFNIFNNKQTTGEQALVKQETLKALDPELLEEFMRAAEGMEAFCTPPQLRDMEFFAQSVRTQWEACFSAEGSLFQAGQQLEALKELCDTLSPEDAHRLAQVQLHECEKRLAAIQHQFSGDRRTPPPDTGVPVEPKQDLSPQKMLTVEIAGPEAVPVQRPKTADKKEIMKQMSTEEDRYRSCRFALQAQLNRNEQSMLGDRPSESTTATDLWKRLRELKALRDETECLWSDYEAQSGQLSERAVEQDRAELTVKWRDQRGQLQSRVDSLGSALELMDSIEQHIAEISECLDKFIKEPKDVKVYTLVNSNILKDVKDLDDSIQEQMDRLSRFDSEPSHLDLRDRSPLTQVVLNHRSSLDRLRQQVRKSDAAARALDRFLLSLRTVDRDISFVRGSPCREPSALQDIRSKLALIRKGVRSLSDKAPQLDQLLGGARLAVTQEGSPISCLDMVDALVRRVEEADDRLMIRQEEFHKEQQDQGLRLKRKTLLAELRKVLTLAEKQGLKEPTIPALQHRMRVLSDLEAQINSLQPEFENLRGGHSEFSPEHQEQAEDKLESLWDETERSVAKRQEQCSILMELLKKFQNCRSYLSDTIQRAEQAIIEHASYMSKDNLQRLITKVYEIKEDLSCLGPKMEEFRSVCRQLQSHLKKIPDCSETPFEAEADALVDSWLDVSEKTDQYVDNLHVGLEQWEKQLLLGEALESWASAKLSLFAESHPFSSEEEVIVVKDEIQEQEESVERFHRKSLEIQEMLQSCEAPLQLQIMETGLRKKMEQVKELFSECTSVFQELMTVRAHLLQQINDCRSAVQEIHSSVSTLSTDNRAQLEQSLQDFSEQLLDQEEQAESLTKEIMLMSSVSGPKALEELTSGTKHLKDSVASAQELICQKKGQAKKGFVVQTMTDECQLFEDWLQDMQLTVNECFENPERREDVDSSMHKLEGFLASKEGEQRLAQVKETVERREQERLSAETEAQLSAWQQEQEGELATLRAHCQGRHKQLKDILLKFASIQEEHDHLQEWLRQNEQLLDQMEQLRQVHEEFLKESIQVEAFIDLLASVRLRGLRADPLLRDSESLIDRYHSLGIHLENQAQVHENLEKEIETFHSQEESFKTWVRDLKHGLESLPKDSPIEEKLSKAQAVLNLSAEGDFKLAALKKGEESLCAYEELEEGMRQELIQALKSINDEWKRTIDVAQQLKAQAELQHSIIKELESLQDLEKNIKAWVEEQRQILSHLERDPSVQERHNKVQAILSLQNEGNTKLTALRKRGESLCFHKELENEKRQSIDQNRREMEEEWKSVLQAAQELKNKIECEDTLSKEVQTFQDQEKNTQAWIRKLKETLDSLNNASPVQEKLNRAQAVIIHRPEGDTKLDDLESTCKSVCACEGLGEDIRECIRREMRRLREEWAGVQHFAQELRNQAELQEALAKDLEDFNLQEESIRAWVTEQHQMFESLGKDTPVLERLVILQGILNLQPEGDSKMAALKKKGESLFAHRELEDKRKYSIQQTLKELHEKWRIVLETTQELRNKAEIQDSLTKELQTFHYQEENTRSWVEELKKDLQSLGQSTHGTQDQIEERLSKAQSILSLRPQGNCKITSLKRRAESLYGHTDLDEDTRHSLSQKLKCLEEEWKIAIKHAQELHSLLKSVLERLVSCQCQRQQTQSLAEQLKQQVAALPHLFPWPGLGDRRHAAEQASVLLERARSLTPTLSALRALGREMSQLTRDPSWTDPTWSAMEECVPGLIQELMELCESLDMSISTERICAQLVEQHSAAQDWMREQVRGFGALPTDRRGLQGAISTLKALLQTVEREEKEMDELDSVKDSLMNLCTPEGCDALTLEVKHLHNLYASSETEIKERLGQCEARLAETELKLASQRQGLMTQAEHLLKEFRAQDHYLGFGESNKSISQLQENWHNFKTCEKELEELEVKVRELGLALRMLPSDEDIPADVISLVDTVTQQYCSIRSKLSERQNDCADNAVCCVREALNRLHTWNQSTCTQPPSISAAIIQAMIEEGAGLHKNLQVAVSHKELLRDCLGPELAGKLERDGTNALKDADTLMNDLKQRLLDLEEKTKQEDLRSSLETQTVKLVTQDSAEMPSTPYTATSADLDWSKLKDIIVTPTTIGSHQTKEPDTSSVVQPSEPVLREVSISVTTETRSELESPTVEQPLETLAMDAVQAKLLNDDLPACVLAFAPKQESEVDESVITVNIPITGKDECENCTEVAVKELKGKEKVQPAMSKELPACETPEESTTCVDTCGSESVTDGVISAKNKMEKSAEEEHDMKVECILSTTTSVSTVMDTDSRDSKRNDEKAMVQPSNALHGQVSVTGDEKSLAKFDPAGQHMGTTMDDYQTKVKTADLPSATLAITSKLETSVSEFVILESSSAIVEKENTWTEKEQKGGEKMVQPSLSEDFPYSEILVEERPMEFHESESPRTEVHENTIYTGALGLESVTEKIASEQTRTEKAPEELVECLFPLNTPVSTAVHTEECREHSKKVQASEPLHREIPTSPTEETSGRTESPAAELATLEMVDHQSELETAGVAAPTELVTKVTETAVQVSCPATAEGESDGGIDKIEREQSRGKKLQDSWGEKLNDEETIVEGLYKEMPGSEGLQTMSEESSLRADSGVLGSKIETTAEDVLGKSLYIPGPKVLLEGDSKVSKKKVATLILDTDTVHIHSAEILGSNDHDTARIVTAAAIGYDTTLSQPLEILENVIPIESDVTREHSNDSQDLVCSMNVTVSSKPCQLHATEQGINIPLQSPVLSAQTIETQYSEASPTRAIAALSGNNEPNAVLAEREGSWAIDIGPQEAYSVREPFTLDQWTVDTDPTEILEQTEIHRELVADTIMAQTDASRSKCDEAEGVGAALEKGEKEFDKESVSDTVEAKDKPTPPATYGKEAYSLSLSSEVQSEEVNAHAVPSSQHYKDDDKILLNTEAQVPHAEVLTIPLNRQHKDKLGSKRLSHNLDYQPTPPTRIQKEMGDVRRISLDLETQTITPARRHIDEEDRTDDKAIEEPFVKPTPPIRQKASQTESDIISVVAETQNLEETVVRPSPLNMSDQVSSEMASKITGSPDLEQDTAVEEPLAKPTPPVRKKQSQAERYLISGVSEESEETLKKLTLPTRRKDIRNVSDIVSTEMVSRIFDSTDLEKTLIQEENAIKGPLVKPTTPVRRKLTQTESDIISVVSETPKIEEALVKPTPSTRRKDSRNMNYIVSGEMASRIADSSELEKTLTQETDIEEPLVKPTPPVRRKASQAEGGIISVVSETPKIEEAFVKPTPPTRRKDSRNINYIVSGEMASRIADSSELEKTLTQETDIEEPLVKPTPPVRRKASQAEGGIISVVSETPKIEETFVKPTPPTTRRDSINDSNTMSTESGNIITRTPDLEKTVPQERAVEEALGKPTPPVREKLTQTESDIISMVSETPKMEEDLVKPSPPTSEKHINMSDTITGENNSRITDSSELEKTLKHETSSEEPLVKPTPPVRRKASQVEYDIISVVSATPKIEEPLVKPTTPVRRTASQTESEIILGVSESQETEETLVKSTLPTRTRESRNVSDIVCIEEASRISESTDLENTPTQKAAVEETLIKPTPPVRQKTGQAENDIITVVSETPKIEEAFVKPKPPTRRRDSINVSGTVSTESDSIIASSTDLEKAVQQETAVEEALVKPTPPVREKFIQIESDIISVVSETPKMEEALVKPSAPTRQKDGKNMRDTVSDEMASRIADSSELEKTLKQVTAIEESLVKPTPPVGTKASQAEGNIISVVSETPKIEETFVKPTPPTRRRDIINVSGTVSTEIDNIITSTTDLEKTVPQETAVEEAIGKPTPPVREKLIQTESDIISVVSETPKMEEALVKPSVPTRQKDGRNMSDTVSSVMSSRIADSSELENTLTQETAIEEPLVKPTPPVGTKASQAEGDIILGVSESQETVETLVKSTLPTIMRECRNVSDIVSIEMASRISESTDLENTPIQEATVEETLVKSSPPMRRKASQAEGNIISVVSETPKIEETFVEPTPPTKRRDSINVTGTVSTESDSIITSSIDLKKTVPKETDVEEALVKPTPPVREQLIKTESDIISVVSETPKMEEALVKPSPLTRQKDGKNMSDTVSSIMSSRIADSSELENTLTQGTAIEETLVKPTPPVGTKASQAEGNIISVVSETPKIEETFVKPTPPTRRRDIINVSGTVSTESDSIITSSTDLEKTVSQETAVEEALVKPTTPLRRKDSPAESDIILGVSESQETEETLVKSTLPTRMTESRNLSDIVSIEMASRISESTNLEKTPTQEAETIPISQFQETVVKPPPALKENYSKLETEKLSETFSSEFEDALPKSPPPNGQKKDTTVNKIVSVKLEELPIKLAPPSMHKEESEKVEVQQITQPNEVWTQIEDINFVPTQDIQQSEAGVQNVSVSSIDGQSQITEEEEPLGPTMRDIFTEIKKMSRIGPNSLLMETTPREDTLEILDTSVADIEAQLNRLVFRILGCRNLPAILNPTDMAKQVEEAECCRQSAQKQVSSMSKQDHANGDISVVANGSGYDPEAMQRLSCQWTAALWDATGTVHSKEAQLQLVIDYSRQTQKVKATLEKLAAELEALMISPAESSFVEEQRLRSFLRTMDQERAVLGEVIRTHSQLSSHLSQPEEAAAQDQQRILQSEWRSLERSTEKRLHNVCAYTKESFNLLQDLGDLKDHLDYLQKILVPLGMSPVVWHSKKVQEMIGLSADITAAQQWYFCLQQSSHALSQGLNFKTEAFSIEQGLQAIKDQLDIIDEQVASSFPKSSNPTLEKIVKVIKDALAWGKQAECDIQRKQKKVSLLPEEVHQQIKDLKKLQSDINSKHMQLEALTEEVTQFIPKLDKSDIPMVMSFLEILEGLSQLTAEKLTSAIGQMESSLQTREKMSEQIADVDSWVLGHLQREALRREDYQSLNAEDLDRRIRQSQDTLVEAEKQSAVTEALLMNSKDIASELSILDNSWLNEKITKLQEDIKEVVSYEQFRIQEIADLLQSLQSSQRKVCSLEEGLRQIMVDVRGCRFPITKDTLSAVEPFKHMIIDHKYQLEQVNPCAEDKRKELLCVITELHHTIKALYIKAKNHEKFLSLRQCVEDLRENVEVQVPNTKNESIDKEKRYKTCQALLVHIPLIKRLCKETSDELENISPDLYPSQLTAEQQRLRQNLENLNTWELAIKNNLLIMEWEILQGVHYPSERRIVQDFLNETNWVLEQMCKVEPTQEAVEKEIRKSINLRKNIEARMRVVDVLQSKKGRFEQRSEKSQYLMEMAKTALDNCDQRMDNLSSAKGLLKNYSIEVTSTIQFLQRTESVLLPSLCSARSCSEQLKDMQQALSVLDTDFQTHVNQLQTLAPFHLYFSKQRIEHLRAEILSHLLVRVSTLKAQAQLRLEALLRCVNCQKATRICYENLCQQVRDLETILAECVSKKITSQKDYSEQLDKLKTLVEEVDTLPGQLEALREWCPVLGCRANREDAVSALWGQVNRLQRCTKDLKAHLEQKGEEWISITNSMEQASVVLDEVMAELPEGGREKASREELHELLQFWSDYQDKLDCQHRALSALELRVARLLGVPAHVEQAPPIPLCQQLQTMQESYHSLKERSAKACKATRAEVEERERVHEELQGIREWIIATVTFLSALEQSPSTKKLQGVHAELCTQKAVLQRVMERLRMKYSDMYTLVPVEIEGPLQEVSHSLQEVEEKVEDAVERCGPVHRLGAKMAEIMAGLESVQSWLEHRSPNVPEAEKTLKRVWDELDGLHSRLAAVEVELQDVSEEEAWGLMESLAQTQQAHARLAKQAEERTAFLNKIHRWLQEHQEMVQGAQSWITEAQMWLTAPCTYTTARCLYSHVNALQLVLDDSAQIRQTLQGFDSVLREMASVCDTSRLQHKLSDTDRRVADTQNSLLEPVSQLEHAAAEVDAMESELKVMEKDVLDLRSALTLKEGISQDKLKAVEDRIELMKNTVAEIQNCKAGLGLPEGVENSLTVFKSAELLLNQLLELEQLVLEDTIMVMEPPLGPCERAPLTVFPSIAEEDTQESSLDQGQTEIVHVRENVLTWPGAALMTVKESTVEQRLGWMNEESSRSPDHTWVCAGPTPADVPVDSAQRERTDTDSKVAEGTCLPSGASTSEAVPKPPATVRTQSSPRDLVTETLFVREPSKPPSSNQLKCVVS